MRPRRWHPQSTMTHEAGLAVARLGGDGAFWRFSDALYERQADFFDETVWDMSRRQVRAPVRAWLRLARPRPAC